MKVIALIAILAAVVVAQQNGVITTGPEANPDGECVTTVNQYPGDTDFSVHAVYTDACGDADKKVCLKFPNGPPPGPGGGAPGDCIDWTYFKDSNNDGSGGCGFEMLGIAHKHTRDYSYFIIESYHPLNGTKFGDYVEIDYGDLLINFADLTGSNVKFATNDGTDKMWGIHFAPNGDGSQEVPGVFSGVTSESQFRPNSGYRTWQRYLNWAGSKAALGTDLDVAGYSIDKYYFDTQSPTPTNINSSVNGLNRECGFDYLIFPEDAGSGDCGPTSSQRDSRYCKNNPRAQHYWFGGVEDDKNVCDSTHANVNDIGCIDVTDQSLGYTANRFGRNDGCNRNTPGNRPYRVGLRIPNSCFGANSFDPAQNTRDFRACYTVECGNDIVCLDGEFTCPPQPPIGGGGSTPCVDITGNQASGNWAKLAQNSLYRILDQTGGNEGTNYGLRYDGWAVADGGTGVFSFEDNGSRVYQSSSGDFSTGNGNIRIYGYLWGGKKNGKTDNKATWSDPDRYFVDITLDGCMRSNSNGYRCREDESGVPTANQGVLVRVGGTGSGKQYTVINFKKRNDDNTYYISGKIKNKANFVSFTGWLMGDQGSGTRDFLGKYECVEPNSFEEFGNMDEYNEMCARLNREPLTAANGLGYTYHCGNCIDNLSPISTFENAPCE